MKKCATLVGLFYAGFGVPKTLIRSLRSPPTAVVARSCGWFRSSAITNNQMRVGKEIRSHAMSQRGFPVKTFDAK